MGGMHLLNDFSACIQTHAHILANQQLKFEEAFQAMKGMQNSHEQLEKETNTSRETRFT